MIIFYKSLMTKWDAKNLIQEVSIRRQSWLNEIGFYDDFEIKINK